MSTETKQLMKSLSQANCKQVEKVVMRFANAHPEAVILPFELDQVYRDVIKAVKLQALFPTNQLPAIRSWEQSQHYVQRNLLHHNLSIDAKVRKLERSSRHAN